MTDGAIVRLAQIAHEYDRAGKPHHADIIEDAMIRLSQSAVGNWWNGVKQVGEGLVDDSKAAGNAIAAPFEGIGAGAPAAWNTGIKNAPAAALQAASQTYGQAQQTANMAQWLQQAIQAHRANGAGRQVIHNATLYG